MSSPKALNTLIPPSFLFHIRTPLRRTEQSWNEDGFELDARHVIPSFHAELDEGPRFGDLRLAWNQHGLLVWLRVEGKKQSPWCRDTRIDDSDGIMLLIDTRNTKSIHLASRFCHQFVFLPAGRGRLLERPVATLREIHRARENPRLVDDEVLKIRCEKRVDGYLLQALIPADALTGFDPEEFPELGFNYVIRDRELGWQSFILGSTMPLSDPSLWGTLQLLED